MKKTNIIIVAVVVLALLAAGFIFIRNEKATAPSGETTETEQTELEKDSQDNQEEPASTENTITYSGDEFSPSELTISEGEEVTIINESSETLDFASDDHPTHNVNSELNVGLIEPGEQATFKPSKGEWGYHDHLNAFATGNIVVE